MIKRLLTILLTFITLTATAQVQEGVVRTIERPQQPAKYLSGATIRVRGEHNAVESNANGKFELSMRGKTEGDEFVLQSVTKSGYELNDRGVLGRKFAYSSKRQLTLLMVLSSQLQDDKIRIENNAYKVAQKNYDEKVAKLEKQLKERTISIEQYRTEIKKIQKSFDKYQSLIEELAEHYAHTDYYGLDDDERQINIWIEEGELEKADSLLKKVLDKSVLNGDINGMLSKLEGQISSANAIISEENSRMAEVLRQQAKDAEHLYQLYTIALSRFDNEKAELFITTRAALDTTNIEWLLQAGNYYNDFLGKYDKALYYYNMSYRMIPFYNGEQEYIKSLILNKLGDVYDKKNEFEKAKECQKEALTLSNNLYDVCRLRAEIYYGLGAISYHKSENDSALYYYQQALLIIQENDSSNVFYIAKYKNLIGSVYDNLGEYEIAKEIHLDARNTYRRISPYHPYFGWATQTLAWDYERLEDYNKALELYNEALEVLLKVCGEYNANVGWCYNNIGSVYEHLGRYEEATQMHTKAMEIRKKLFPEGHTDIAASENHFGQIEMALGNYDKAESHFYNALNIYDNYSKANNMIPKEFSWTYNNLGLLEQKRGNYTMSVFYHKKAIDSCNKIFGDNITPDLASCLCYMGEALLKKGDFKEAKECLEKSYFIRCQFLSSEHSEVISVLKLLDETNSLLNN